MMMNILARGGISTCCNSRSMRLVLNNMNNTLYNTSQPASSTMIPTRWMGGGPRNLEHTEQLQSKRGNRLLRKFGIRENSINDEQRANLITEAQTYRYKAMSINKRRRAQKLPPIPLKQLMLKLGIGKDIINDKQRTKLMEDHEYRKKTIQMNKLRRAQKLPLLPLIHSKTKKTKQITSKPSNFHPLPSDIVPYIPKIEQYMNEEWLPKFSQGAALKRLRNDIAFRMKKYNGPSYKQKLDWKIIESIAWEIVTRKNCNVELWRNSRGILVLKPPQKMEVDAAVADDSSVIDIEEGKILELCHENIASS